MATMRRVCFQAVEGAALDVLQSIGDLMQPFILTGVIADHFGGAFKLHGPEVIATRGRL